AQFLRRLFGGPPADGPPPFGDPNNGEQQGPDFPNCAPKQEITGTSLNADVTPNGFEEWPDHRYIPPTPYVITFRGEYLRWQIKDGTLAAPLVTRALRNGTGSLGEADTQILLGQGDYSYEGSGSPGGRATFGIAPGFFFPIEISGFAINDQQ